MLNLKKESKVDNILYRYMSSDICIKYICARCNREKISKKYAEYSDINGNIKRICNGCYGFLLSNKNRDGEKNDKHK